MALYQVFKGHDAYVEYVTVIEAEDTDAAIEKAHSRSLDTWIPAGIIDEFYSFDVLEDRIDLLEATTFEEAVKQIHDSYDFVDLRLKPQQRELVLAALSSFSYWQAKPSPLLQEIDALIQEIKNA
jgi:hypothetical protein